MPREVDRHQVQQLLREGAQLVDVMGGKEFEASHIVGAVNIPIRKLAAEARRRLDPSRGVITYGYDSL
ncbi:MAG: rhodanese-like domain-containing protein [Acidimicrobiales bacterium]|nr:rhodanese-like domain-containing protein [Actinomycetota bacterium]